jgi:hypothetical protein
MTDRWEGANHNDDLILAKELLRALFISLW